MSMITLLKDQRPDSCFLDQIYDPDKDGEWTSASPKLVPNEGASVTDRITGILYYVESVDEATLRTTLRPSKILVDSEEETKIDILSYGNDKFMLYYDERVKPTKLIVDTKLVIYGASLSTYRLSKIYNDGTREVISVYVDNNGNYVGDRIPLTSVGTNSSTKQLTNCHTLSQITDGETIEAEVYDNAGVISVVIKLFTKKATFLNDLMSSTTIITGFDATSNQMTSDRDFYIYQRQEPSQLGITPILTYADGTTEQITIDNTTCFMYGIDDFVPSFPGQKQKVLIKKFLTPKQSSDIDVQDGRDRYVSVEKWVTVLQNETIDNIKVSVIPIYDLAQAQYVLKLLAYSDRRTTVTDITDYATYITTFDGTKYDTLQEVTFTVDLEELLSLDKPAYYQQRSYVQLKPVSMFQKYILTDDPDTGIFYGVESSTIRRPVFEYDTTKDQYLVSTSRFQNKEAFLEAFYYKSQPPFNTEVEVVPTVPTHFTIRDVDTLGVIIPTPVEIDQYDQLMNVSRRTDGTTYVGQTVIFEFLTNVADEYQLIYGVPVDVINL